MFGKIVLKQPIQAIPLASVVSCKNPLSWSQDNNIVLISAFGGCLLALHMAPNSDHSGLLFDRTHLGPPETHNPNIMAGKDLQSLVKDLEPQEAQSIMLDATLSSTHRAHMEQIFKRSTTSAGYIFETNHRAFRRAVWSPAGVAERNRCMLCLVTYDHQIQLVCQLGIQWKTVFDLSSLWFQYLLEDGKTIYQSYANTVGTKKHHKFIAETRFLAVTEVTWTGPITIRNAIFFALIIVTASFHVAIFRIPQFTVECFRPVVSNCFALTGLTGRTSVVSWFNMTENKSLLLLGTSAGSVQIHSVIFEDCNEVEFKELLLFDYKLKGMAVNHIELIALPKEGWFVLVVAQHSALVVHLLSLEELEAKVLSSAHFLMCIYSISGLKVISSSLVSVCVKDGRIVEVEILVDVDAVSISLGHQEKVFESTGVLYNGFAFSPNNALLAVVENLSVPYDYLHLREPTMINLFQICNDDDVLRSIKEGESRRMNLYEHVDSFESVRLSVCRDRKLSFPRLLVSEIDSLSSYMKRVHLWYAVIRGRRSEAGGMQVASSNDSLVDALLESIIEENIMELFSSRPVNAFPKNEDQKISLNIMCEFLEKKNRSHPFMKNLKKHILKENVPQEKCFVCLSPVEFKSIKSAICPKGHTLPRCLRSLLSTKPIYKCTICQLFYNPSLPVWIGEEGKKCLICSMTIQRSVRGRKYKETEER